MVGADGLTSFHSAARAGFCPAGKPAIPASRLALVVKPTSRWFELSILTIIKTSPLRRGFYMVVDRIDKDKIG